MASAQEALNRLQEGNLRFASGMQNSGAPPDDFPRSLTLEQQDPFAIILGCSDSRVLLLQLWVQHLRSVT